MSHFFDSLVKQELSENDKTITDHFLSQSREIWYSTDKVLLKENRSCGNSINGSFHQVKKENDSNVAGFINNEDESYHKCFREITENKEINESEFIKKEIEQIVFPEDSDHNHFKIKDDEDVAVNKHLNVEQYNSHICDFGTNGTDDLQDHLTTAHLKPKNTTNRGRSSLKYHLQQPADNVNPQLNTYQCNYCDFTSSIKVTLKHHVDRTHLQNRSFKCKYCTYVTVEKYRLRYHVEGVHLKINKYKCDFCDYSAAVKSNLDRHIDCVHLQLNNYSCSFCDYVPKKKNYLKIHMKRVHANIKNHKCQMCAYSATRKNDLQRHIDNVHLKLRNQKCPFCEYTTTQKGNLKRHVKRVHSNQ